MKLLAWMYMKSPLWVVRLLPDRINHADSGRFNSAALKAYDRGVAHSRRKPAKRKKGK